MTGGRLFTCCNASAPPVCLNAQPSMCADDPPGGARVGPDCCASPRWGDQQRCDFGYTPTPVGECRGDPTARFTCCPPILDRVFDFNGPQGATDVE